MNNKVIENSISRITTMEILFDKLTEYKQNLQNIFNSADLKNAVKTLANYYSNGDWLFDYELDEQKLLPHDLKRGVLSQDGLYNLLCDLDAENMTKFD